MAESFGVQGRGKFYEEAGAIRDVVQNHLLQVVALLADGTARQQDHRVRSGTSSAKLLKAIRTLTPADVVRGQFRGYRQEPGVAADSRVETFAAIRLHIDNWRWGGVPFFIRAGKCLPVTATEVIVELQRPAGSLRRRPSATATIPLPLEPGDGHRAGPTRVMAPGRGGGTEFLELIARHDPTSERHGAVRASPRRRVRTATRRCSRARTRSRRRGASSIRSWVTPRRCTSTSRGPGVPRRPTR